jgi:MscS family membrane protein
VARRLSGSSRCGYLAFWRFSSGSWAAFSCCSSTSGAFGEGYAVALTLALIAAGAWAAWLAAYFVVEVIISSPTIPDQSYDAHLLRLLARVAAVVGAAAVLVYGANQVGVPALGLVAGLGVGGFALALTAQSTVENLFGGMNLFADRPFRVGDVRSATVVGLVGAGGIGQVFFEAFRGFDYQATSS